VDSPGLFVKQRSAFLSVFVTTWCEWLSLPGAAFGNGRVMRWRNVTESVRERNAVGAGGKPSARACGVTRPVRFHNENTQPTANGKSVQVGAYAETSNRLGVRHGTMKTPPGGFDLECSPEGQTTSERREPESRRGD